MNIPKASEVRFYLSLEKILYLLFPKKVLFKIKEAAMNKIYTTLLMLFTIISAQAQFTDDFESYTVGSYLAVSSPIWTTWSNLPGSSEDVKITDLDAHSGTKSIYLSSTSSSGGPADLILPFGAAYNTGQFKFETWMKVVSGKGAYFNFQGKASIGEEWALDVYFVNTGALIMTSDGKEVLNSTYPTNTWFKLTFDINLNTNEWEVLVDGNSIGIFANPINRIASWDVFPLNPAGVGGNNQAGFYIDDVSFTVTPYTLTARNGAVILIDNKFRLVGQTAHPSVTIRNLGTSPITAFDVSINYDGNVITKSVTGVNIASLATYVVEFSQDVTAASGANVMTATISNVNGQGADLDPADDSKSITINPITPAPGKIIIAEEGTGTWCGWCPRGTVAMAEMTERYSQFFQGIAVHNNDPMAHQVYDSGLGGLISGYPSALVNRGNDIDPTGIEEQFLNLITQAPVAIITNTATYNAGTGELTVNMKSDFQAATSGNWRVALVLTEDGVKGSGTGWGQSNYYSYQSQNIPLIGAGLNWQQEPATVSASKMVYDHVARTIVPSFGGQGNVFPTSISTGESFNYEFKTTITSGWNTENMHIVTMLINPAGKIDNAGVMLVRDATPVGMENKINDFSVDIYPNPSSGLTRILWNDENINQATITITDISGKVVLRQEESNLAQQFITLDLSNYSKGIYLLQVKSEDKSVVRKLVVQ